MKEIEYLKIINTTLSETALLGDDCAVLDDLGICITQDTLVEGVHFLRETISPFELGQKSINVNLSDLAAIGAMPLYVTISLSLPKSLNEKFVEAFYQGVEASIKKYGVKVAGGDLTASDKVVVSVCAIGKKYNDVVVTRSCAKPDDVIVVTGCHGDSSGGLKLLLHGKKEPSYLIKKHLVPVAQVEKSKALLKTTFDCGVESIAMMDSSDGLGDALYKLSKGCGFAFDVDYSSIPVSSELKKEFPDNWMEYVLWGGEDFELVFCVNKKVFEKLDKTQFFKIGVVSDRPFSDDIEKEFENKSYRHF